MTVLPTYDATRERVETYFDRTATRTWERLTSDAPVSGIRATVRRGRDQMREVLLSAVPRDLTGQRVLDAGCGTGALSIELAKRGAQVTAVDISPRLIEIAKARADGLPITWHTGDMFSRALGRFDHAIAMDSMIYYATDDLAEKLGALVSRISGRLLFTVAPRTPLLMAMWRVGKLFPRSDRSPTMIPQSPARVATALRSRLIPADLAELETVRSGFYISAALKLEGRP